MKSLSRVRLFATPWTTAYQAPQSMRFSRQEYWIWVPLPSPFSHKFSCCYKPLPLGWIFAVPWNFPGKSNGVGCHCLLPTLTYLIPIQVNPIHENLFLKGDFLNATSRQVCSCLSHRIVHYQSCKMMTEFTCLF